MNIVAPLVHRRGRSLGPLLAAAAALLLCWGAPPLTAETTGPGPGPGPGPTSGATSTLTPGPEPPVASPAPQVAIEDRTGIAGPVTMVVLRSWPLGSVSVTVCGDAARRGSEDCDAVGAQAAPVPLGGEAMTRLPRLAPPIDCPCVVRVASRDQKTVVTAPLVVPGRRVMRPDELPPLRTADLTGPGSITSDGGGGGDGIVDIAVALSVSGLMAVAVVLWARRRRRRHAVRSSATVPPDRRSRGGDDDCGEEDDFFVVVDASTDPVLDDFFVAPDDPVDADDERRQPEDAPVEIGQMTVG